LYNIIYNEYTFLRETTTTAIRSEENSFSAVPVAIISVFSATSNITDLLTTRIFLISIRFRAHK
jgi:hypothetical protein